MIKQFDLPVKNHFFSKCHSCLIGKTHQSSYPSRSRRSSEPLDLVYADVWGPAPTLAIGGERFYVNFVDDFSPFNWLFPIPTMRETIDRKKLIILY